MVAPEATVTPSRDSTVAPVPICKVPPLTVVAPVHEFDEPLRTSKPPPDLVSAVSASDSVMFPLMVTERPVLIFHVWLADRVTGAFTVRFWVDKDMSMPPASSVSGPAPALIVIACDGLVSLS